jgi:hypothetical protein
MKRNFILTILFILVASESFSQYIGVRAKYIDSRLIPNPGFPDSRQNRLILCFYNVDPLGLWTPISVTNYDMYIKDGDIQVDANTGSVIDSMGNNYHGYDFTAPIVAAYYNSLGREFFDCNSNGSLHLVANGHELDCGWVKVSEWMLDYLGSPLEIFTTIDVGLPFYFWPDPLYLFPGNVNFGPFGTLSGGPYNMYNFSCGGPLQLINRGQMWADSVSNSVPLPIHFANLSATIDGNCKATIQWSNLSESNIAQYIIERSIDNGPFLKIDSILPIGNTGGNFNYHYSDPDSILGYNLYRIKALETTGNFYYSMVLRINGCRGGRGVINQPKLVIYPNPSYNGRFVLSASDLPAGKYEVVLISMTGRKIKITSIDHGGGDINKLFDVGWAGPGAYILSLRSSDLNLTQKIIVSN